MWLFLMLITPYVLIMYLIIKANPYDEPQSLPI